MVAAREAFLGAGHYAPIAESVAATAHASAAGRTEAGVCVVDLGAGTGHYLAAVLDELTDAWGIALDASRPALRRALRAHPRIGAVACDVWHELPIQTGAANLIVNVFAPRNGREIARILSPNGKLVVVTPTPDHLRELVSNLGMLRVDEDKQPRVHAALAPHLGSLGSRQVDFEMTLGGDDVEAVVAMGPSARHMSTDVLRRRISQLPEPLGVTGSVIVETFGKDPAG
jgi:23S rRNA (guanine745-N1)-methyltransferase